MACDTVSVTVDQTTENISIDVTCDSDTVTVSTTDVIEAVAVTATEKVYDPATVWINLATGYDLQTDPEIQTTTLPGEVLKYTYKNGTILYRYTPDDFSSDDYYTSFTDPTLSGLVVKREVTP